MTKERRTDSDIEVGSVPAGRGVERVTSLALASCTPPSEAARRAVHKRRLEDEAAVGRAGRVACHLASVGIARTRTGRGDVEGGANGAALDCRGGGSKM